MRLSTEIKHRYERTDHPILRAIKDGGLIRLTVTNDTPHLYGEVRRVPAGMMIGGESKTREWVWVMA